jgi:hypothetical protein
MLSVPGASQKSSTLNSKSSMLDFVWGVQDSLGGAKTRDSSRRTHSPPTAQMHEDIPCLV